MDHEQQVRETWAALSRGDFETVEAAFAADARWRAVEDGEWNCENRTQILNVMRENRARRVLEGDVEEVLDVGERVVVAFRPARHDPEGWPLDNGIRYVVLTLENGLVTEMKGCLNRQVALHYAAT
jgi:ketosteroid isomerase-like protein